ncbi:MAG: tetratricopeptide repeat protein, partial [Thermoguttaceae bacterium]
MAMRWSLMVFLTAAVLAAAVSPTAAQVDAQAAYQQAKAAYQAARFAEARDLATKATETDPKNPEVFLLLGKALYQLGELDDALAAWKRTLALAPQEPFAAKMLEVLQARRADTQTRIKLVEVLVAERLFPAASQQCRTLLEDKAVSSAQRAAVLTLQAEVAVRTAQPAEAQKILREVLALYPKEADPIQTKLLLGQAKVYAGGPGTADGLLLLKEVAGQGDTLAAATAQWELVGFELTKGVGQARTAAYAKWVADHPKFPRIDEACGQLITAYLTLTVQGEPPVAESPLGPSDAAALAVADELIRRSVRAEEVAGLVERFRKHFESHYAQRQAFSAAADGIERLLALPLPRPSRLMALRALAADRKAIALAKLAKDAKAGRLAAADPAAVPKELAQAVAAYDKLRREDPAAPPWTDLIQLATQVRAVASEVPSPDRVTALRGPDAWAIAILMPVLKADPDAQVAKPAIEICYKIVGEYQALNQPGAWPLALAIDREVVGALPAGSTSLPDVLARHAAVLDAYARYMLAENVKAGRDVDNAKLSDAQKEMLGAMAKLVALDAARAPAVLGQVAEHLKAWIQRGHWAVAEEAYAAIEIALPAESRRDAQLAVARLWIEQTFQRDQQLTAVGLTVPRELDPLLKKALLRCYELQGGLDLNSPKLPQVRGVWDSIVAHYKALEYEDVAEAAIRARPEKEKVDAADQYAEFQGIRLQEDRARRELTRLLRQYGAREKIALTPALKAVLAAWTQWIADRPTSPLAPQAVEQVLGIGQLYERHGAADVAAGIYADFAKFSAGVKVLAQSSPGQPGTAQRVAYLAASALDRQAAKVLARAMADRKPDDPPPARLSDEYLAAVAGYKAFLAAHPDGALAGDAIRRIMAVAVEYAKIDAWDAAESVYADLQQMKLAIRRPERLEFARGVCQLGRAMPAHAREILAALGSAGLGGEEEKGEAETALAAVATSSPARPKAPAAGPVADEGRVVLNGEGLRVAGEPASGSRTGGGALAIDGRMANPSINAPDTHSAADDPFAAPAGQPMPQTDQAKQDTQLLAMIQQQESSRSARVAQLRDQTRFVAVQPGAQGQVQQAAQAQAAPSPLSEAELSRLDKAIAAAYGIFQDIRKKYADTPTAAQARGEILVMVGYWRGLAEWQRSAALAVRFLG